MLEADDEPVQVVDYSRILARLQPQQLAPGTPAHSQDSPPQADASVEVSSPTTAAPLPSAQATCRADLSGAALLLSQHFTAGTEPPSGRAHQTQPPDGNPARRKEVFAKGNYSRYYGYRLAAGETEDPRLQVFEKRWFVNKRCLDIGCNEGNLTRAIAMRFRTRSMLGMDVDQKLIRRACLALSAERTAVSEKLANRHMMGHSADTRVLYGARESLSNVWFKEGDFLASKLEAGSMDTITCMSVTKWVHLHGGDDVMRAFFLKVKEVLCPGGYFVLEPQPWKSYKSAVKKLKVQKVRHVPLDEITLRPEEFPAYLTQQLGFRLLKSNVNPSKQAGFGRPIYWFKRV